MAGGPVLGPVVFRAFEVPERISLGGRQQLAIHRLPGGGRVVDAMGPDDAPMRWSGIFSGADAPERVRMLERLRAGGAALPLAWDGWRFRVVIQAFTAETAGPWWIPYQIEVCVLRDGAPAEAEGAPAMPDAAAVAVLAGGGDLEGRIEAASDALAGSDVAAAIGAAGVLARLVTARAFLGNVS